MLTKSALEASQGASAGMSRDSFEVSQARFNTLETAGTDMNLPMTDHQKNNDGESVKRCLHNEGLSCHIAFQVPFGRQCQNA